MKNRFMFAAFYLLMGNLLAAPIPPVPPVYLPLKNDGYVFADIDRNVNGPEFKFCPKGYRLAEIDDRQGALGCGPIGQESKWDGHFKQAQIVKSVNAQQYLDLVFGKDVTKFLGIAPTGNGSYNAIIFYKIN